MKIRTSLIILNIAGLLGSLIWLLTKPDWEPLVTVILLIAALIVQLYGDGKSNNKLKMSQKGGKKSTNYQSSGDIKINIKNDKR
jgi:hypothetical protein